MMHRNRFHLFFFALSLLVSSTTFAFHSANKYFPFLERPEDFLPRKHFFQVTPFYTTTSTAFNVCWGTGRVPELAGAYDLRDVITSLEFVKGSDFVNPIERVTGNTDLVNKKLPFAAKSNIKSAGFSLRAEEYFPSCHMSVGCWMPFAWVTTIARYRSLDKTLTEEKLYTLDKIRRSTHDEIGFRENISSSLQLGDLDLYARWNYALDHKFLLKSFNLDVQIGVLVPTSNHAEHNERTIPTWVPLMSDGFWGFYIDVVPQLELRQDLIVGSIFSAIYQKNSDKIIRLPVFREPANFSALESSVNVNPGVTIKIAPFVILENVADGLHFAARYNYIRHAIDKTFDYRYDKTIPSYLNIKPEDFSTITSMTDKITQKEIDENIKNKEDASKWRSHYISFQGSYDITSKKHWSTQKIYVLYDMPFNGKSIAKTHQISIGYDVSF